MANNSRHPCGSVQFSKPMITNWVLIELGFSELIYNHQILQRYFFPNSDDETIRMGDLERSSPKKHAGAAYMLRARQKNTILEFGKVTAARNLGELDSVFCH